MHAKTLNFIEWDWFYRSKANNINCIVKNITKKTEMRLCEWYDGIIKLLIQNSDSFVDNFLCYFREFTSIIKKFLADKKARLLVNICLLLQFFNNLDSLNS